MHMTRNQIRRLGYIFSKGGMIPLFADNKLNKLIDKWAKYYYDRLTHKRNKKRESNKNRYDIQE